MERLKAYIEKPLEVVTKFIDYLETQRFQNETAQEKEEDHDESIENFIVSDLKTLGMILGLSGFDHR